MKADSPPPRARGKTAPQPEFDENVALTRWANLLAHESQRPVDLQLAASALNWAQNHASARFAYVGGLLLALGESRADPPHVVVVGSRADAVAGELFETAIAEPIYEKQIEWLDPALTPILVAAYPKLGRPARLSVCRPGLLRAGFLERRFVEAPGPPRQGAVIVAAVAL